MARNPVSKLPALDARAFWVTDSGRGEIRSERLKLPGEDDVLVRTLYTGISRGTEALVFHHRVPPAEYERMRAPFQAGQFPGPLKYGYASVGIVESGPSPLRGQNVFCLYPHQDRYVVPATAVHRLPDGVPPGRAVLAANLETAVNGLWDAEPAIGDRIAVVGAGTVGCLVAWLASRMPGAEVELIDIDAEKAETAEALGLDFRSPEQATHDADLVIHASGSAAGLNTALELAGFEARVIEMSWFGSAPVAAALGGSFHSRRLQLRASQVGTIAASQRARWDSGRRMHLVMRLLADPVLDRLISGESRFGDLPAVMQQLSSSDGGALCHRITYL